MEKFTKITAEKAIQDSNDAQIAKLGVINKVIDVLNGKEDKLVNLTLSFSSTTQATSSLTATGTAADINVALVPKGTGALLADIPNGAASGGNARGQYAVDLQMVRSAATQVASGNYCVIGGGFQNTASNNSSVVAGGGGNSATGSDFSTICGGQINTVSSAYSFIGGGQSNIAQTNTYSVVVGGSNNTCSGQYSFIGGGISNGISSGAFRSFLGGGDTNNVTNSYATLVGGTNNTASGQYSFVGGGQFNTASGLRSVVAGGGGSGTANVASGNSAAIGGGGNNSATATISYIPGGYGALAYLHGQGARASFEFALKGDAQTSDIRMFRSITGTAQQELFLDGASAQAILNISSPGPINARAWRAQVDVVAIVQTAGTGTLVLGECFMGSYYVGIKRIGNTTSLVGTVSTDNTVSDTNMSTSIVTIDADTGTNALRIRFTPPTGGTSSATSVIRVVATAYLTEVGY